MCNISQPQVSLSKKVINSPPLTNSWACPWFKRISQESKYVLFLAWISVHNWLGIEIFYQQTWRNSCTSGNQTFMDPNNLHWGWSWLERWMAARPWDNASSIGKELTSDQVSVKSSTSRSLSMRGNAKIHSPATQKQSRPTSRQSPSTPSSKITSRVRPSSSRGTIATDDDLKSMNSIHSDRCRRHSIAGSSVRDDESLASSPAAPGYMTPTESARAKARLPSPLGAGGTPDKMSGGSAKKRLSFSGSPVVTRRHSGPPKIDISHIKDATTNS